MAGKTDFGERGRFQEIDVFRGIAALWVVMFHFIIHYSDLRLSPIAEPPFILKIVAAAGVALPDFGLLPVYWFFMISGFVITWTLERSATVQDFAVSRATRLYPVYWTVVTMTFLAGTIWPLPGQSYSLYQFVWNLTMVQEIFRVPHIDGVYWSLTVELLFYFGMAALFALGLLRHLRIICAAWALACVMNHLLARFGADVWWIVQKYALLPQGHFLIAGIMFYQLWRGRWPIESGAILGVCLVSIYLAYPVREALVSTVFFAAFWLAIRQHLRFIVCAPLLWLGSISYALYLSHEMLGWRVMRALEDLGVSRVAAILVATALMLGLAHLLTRMVERPARLAVRAWRPAISPRRV
jgi:peptidoglycan/LPS O-acetylase OafA/YrhL